MHKHTLAIKCIFNAFLFFVKFNVLVFFRELDKNQDDCNFYQFVKYPILLHDLQK